MSKRYGGLRLLQEPISKIKLIIKCGEGTVFYAKDSTGKKIALKQVEHEN
jgi:hypothetical protein